MSNKSKHINWYLACIAEQRNGPQVELQTILISTWYCNTWNRRSWICTIYLDGPRLSQILFYEHKNGLQYMGDYYCGD